MLNALLSGLVHYTTVTGLLVSQLSKFFSRPHSNRDLVKSSCRKISVYSNSESASGVKLRKSQLKFGNDNTVVDRITVRINAISPITPLVIGVKVETPNDHFRR